MKDFTIHKLIAENFEPKIGVAIAKEKNNGTEKFMMKSFTKHDHATIAFDFGNGFEAAPETINLTKSIITRKQ